MTLLSVLVTVNYQRVGLRVHAVKWQRSAIQTNWRAKIFLEISQINATETVAGT